ncbi:MAG TPA: (2Fe-2S) ferredoxin domain-containing protein [Bacteroidales bacterium]|nr:(2Fe-2S) ferredoxin domain-containing protein [Bacteroidales bacterium]
MLKKTEITICLGSSCFSRGNNKNLEIIKDYISENNLKDKVDFRGHLCAEMCNRGPVVKINGKIYFDINRDNIISILDSYFKKNQE